MHACERVGESLHTREGVSVLIYVNGIIAFALFLPLRGMGKVFRSWHGEVCQLRSLLPTGVPFVALTATATTQVRTIISNQLQMEKVSVVEASPDRGNI